jgi:hypothetical protein
MRPTPLARLLVVVLAVAVVLGGAVLSSQEPAPAAPPAATAPAEPAAPEAVPAPEPEIPLPPVEAWIPRQAVLVLGVPRPGEVLDAVLRPEVLAAVTASPAWRAQADNAGLRQLLNVVQGFERQQGIAWSQILKKLVGGGITLAVGSDGSVLLVVDSLDARMLSGMHDLLMIMARMDPANKDRIRSTKEGDVTVWSVGPEEAHAIVGRRLMITNRPAALKAVLGVRAGTGGEGLAAAPWWTGARKAAGADAAAFGVADIATLKAIPGVAEALAADREPLAALLAAPLLDALGRSSWMAVGLKGMDGAITLEASVDGTIPATGASRFARPEPGKTGALSNLAVPRRIAAMTLYRDLHGFYAAKDDLFPQRTSGLIFFENMMGIFFTGRSLTEEVFAEVGPAVRVVAAEQAYAPDVGTPAVRYPAFALVLPMLHPDRYKPVMEEAWQKAIGLVNFTRGQAAEPGVLIDRPVYKGCKYTVAAFTPETKEDRSAVDVRFNFSPTLAMPGGWMVMSSTEGLARDLIDALAGGADTATGVPPAGTHSLLELDGAQIASLLASNREALVRNNMVEEGKTREEAGAGIDLMLTVVRCIQGATVALVSDAERSKATLTVRYALPAALGGGK